MRKFKFVCLISVLLLPLYAFSATDGTNGLTSSGQLTVGVTKGNEVRISGLSDVNFGANNALPTSRFIDVCIYSTTGSYNVTPTSLNGSNSTFRTTNVSTTNYINYDIAWNNAATGASGSDLNNSVTSNNFTGANTTQNDCSGGKNARIFFSIDSTSFSSAPSGAYSDTLTLVIAPI